jgi:hypothetical protein
MHVRKKWSDLSERQRRWIITVGAFEAVLKVAALIDISRRPANQIRGSKLRWATSIVVVNSAGLLPVSYFVFGVVGAETEVAASSN